MNLFFLQKSRNIIYQDHYQLFGLVLPGRVGSRSVRVQAVDSSAEVRIHFFVHGHVDGSVDSEKCGVKIA